MKNIIKSMIGISISAFGIACVANSDIGCFALTAASKSLGNLTGIPFGVVYMLIEIAFLLVAAVIVNLPKSSVCISVELISITPESVTLESRVRVVPFVHDAIASSIVA